MAWATRIPINTAMNASEAPAIAYPANSGPMARANVNARAPATQKTDRTFRVMTALPATSTASLLPSMAHVRVQAMDGRALVERA